MLLYSNETVPGHVGAGFTSISILLTERVRLVDYLASGLKSYSWRSKGLTDFVALEDPDGNLFCVVQKHAG